MKLVELLKVVNAVRIVGDVDKEVTGIQFDSRRVVDGSLFVAQVGTAVDGHEYIAQCVAQGAVAVVLEKEEYIQDNGVCYILVKNSDEALGRMAHYWYGEPSKHLKLVGVTGTNGKTTTATLLYKLFKTLGYKAGLLSTVVNYVNDEEIPATHTTPNALELNALLAKMVSLGCTHAFMEVSSHSIVQERIAGLDYSGALFTNLTRDHLDYHKTFDN
jgi:UDP-N-acetylmuramoyl-L-alanyl-D-glutamate--2,6-diaminopimelate ligase